MYLSASEFSVVRESTIRPETPKGFGFRRVYDQSNGPPTWWIDNMPSFMPNQSGGRLSPSLIITHSFRFCFTSSTTPTSKIQDLRRADLRAGGAFGILLPVNGAITYEIKIIPST